MAELTISIAPAAMPAILAAGENICIVLNAQAIVTSAAGLAPAAPQVLWQALPAMEQSVVLWDTSQWSLYASDAAAPGSVLQMMATGAAAAGATVPFDGMFGPPAGSQAPGTFGVRNQMPGFDAIVLGLAIGATVNGNLVGLTPLNACPVPAMQYALLTPGATLQVFLQSGTVSGMVLPNSIGSVTQFALGGADASLVLSYDSTQAAFIQQSGSP